MALVTRFTIIKVPDDLSDWPASQDIPVTYSILLLSFEVFEYWFLFP